MKKVFLMLAVAFSMTMLACTNKAENTEAAQEVAAEEVAPVIEETVEAVVDTLNATTDTATVIAGEVIEAVAE